MKTFDFDAYWLCLTIVIVSWLYFGYKEKELELKIKIECPKCEQVIKRSLKE